MADNIRPKSPSALNNPAGPDVGDRHGGQPQGHNPLDILSQGKVHRTRVERGRGSSAPTPDSDLGPYGRTKVQHDELRDELTRDFDE